MSEDSVQITEPTESTESTESTVQTLSHRRILTLMALVMIIGSILSFVFVSNVFGIGVFLGGILSLINYYWLKRSLKAVFEKASAGQQPMFMATKYIARYMTFGAVLAIVYLTKTVPVVAVLLGLASFALAIIIEAFIRLFSNFSNTKEI